MLRKILRMKKVFFEHILMINIEQSNGPETNSENLLVPLTNNCYARHYYTK